MLLPNGHSSNGIMIGWEDGKRMADNKPCSGDPRKPVKCMECGIVNFCPAPRDIEAIEWQRDRGAKIEQS